MKKLFTLIALLFSIAGFGQNCCPFLIQISDSINCNIKELYQHPPGPFQSGPNYSNAADSTGIKACRETKMKYNIVPLSQPPCSTVGFTIDTIIVQGGSLVTNTNSQFCVQWGSGNTGNVLITFHIPGGSVGGPGCSDSILLNFTLLANPIAAFNALPNPACFNNPTNISFSSASSIGAASYFWTFGDGFTSTSPNPTHAYTAAGTYTVCLTVGSTAPSGGGTAIFGNCPSCTDSICKTIVIDNLPGPDIQCVATVCAGTTETYCTSVACSTYNWTATGGNIIGPSNQQCVTVQWLSGNPQGTLNLSVPCAGFCPQGTTVTVPIIPLSTTIAGSAIVCIGSTNSYSLPAFPGTTYNWTISGGQPITGNNTNTAQIVTTWNNAGTYTINCAYYDTALNCGGTGQLIVKVKPQMNITGPKKRCAGQLGIYNALIPGPSTPVPCNWSIIPSGATITSGGSGTSSITVAWANAGTYLIKAVPSVAGLVCDSLTYSVTVYPKPVISAITGKDSICPNGTAVYAATSNMAGLFTWNITGGTPTNLGSNNDSVQIVWNNVGPYTIAVTQSSYANNCPSLAFSKTVFAYPTPNITGPTNVCADNIVSYTITNISSGFNWYITPAQFGTVLSAPGANPAQIKWHGNNNPGGTNVVYLHYGICGNDSIAITITEPIAPTINASGTLCPGGVTLSTAAVGTYTWSCVEHAIQPSQTLTNSSLVGLNLPGHYTVIVQNNVTGCTTTSTYNVPNIGRPVAQIFANGPLAYCLSSLPALPNMTLSAVTTVGYTYQWFLGASLVGTGSTLPVTSTLVNGVGSFVFKCVVTFNGCTDTSNLITVTVVSGCTGTPNPFPPCGANFSITNISGCNPFTLTLGNIIPAGSTIIPGTTTIYHYDDATTISGNTTNTFNSIGVKQVRICANVLKPDLSVCSVCRDTVVSVVIASKFLANNSCGTIALTDLSSVLAPATISAYSWSVLPSGTFSNNSIASPTLIVSSTGTYTITQTVTSSTGCVTSSSQTINITLPNANFNVSNSCVGTVVNLNHSTPSSSTYWNFGDATSSATNPTSHAYAAAGTYTITCTVTDALGCSNSVSKPIVITAAPLCSITVTGSPIFCSGDSVKLSACAGYTNYQWLNNGVAIAGATSQIYYALQTGNYSFTANNPLLCGVKSDTIVVTVNQSPSTSMSFTGSKCFGDIYTVSVPNCAGCFYSWDVDGINQLAGLANQYSGTVGSAPFTLGPHLIKVTIVGSNGCTSEDSVNVIFHPLPSIGCNIVGSPAMLCSNNSYTFNATSNAASPSWSWTLTGFNNILSTTSTLMASVAGTYNVQVTDGLTGCKNSTSHIINESPDLSLFPVGCDTLCQNETIFLPLPSIFGNVSGYTITWYDNAPPYTNILGTGISINLSSLALGAHNLSVIVIGPNGCADTSNVYHIFIVPATSTNISASACGMYTWIVNGVTYTSSGTYTHTSINASGCPQNDTLQLTITNSIGTNVSIATCNFYLWPVNGITYTASGVYTHTTALGNGCIQSDTLTLTLHQSTDSILHVISCGSYTWPANGVTYTASGNYSFTALNPAGCPSYYGLVLTISNGGNITQTATSCNPYLWPINGMTYTASGTYLHTIINPAGCVITYALQLIIHPNCNNTQTVVACDQYTWAVNGITYTQSGTYTYTYLNANGCICTSTLILTIHYTVITTSYITACGSYLWPVNGETYTASCVFTYVINGPEGCPHVYVLCLTILQNTKDTSTITACNNYTWPVTGQTYTSSGVYTYTTTNGAGCIHTSTLILTIHYSSSSSYSITACSSYTWPINGVTYTASGTYTYTSLNAEGCPHTNTLHLVIKPSTSSTLNVVTCDMYTWSATGLTYTSSGVYTKTSLNAFGCVHTATLNLTINYSTTTTYYITACNSYTWLVNGVTYTNSGVFTVFTFNPSGCPNIKILCLTILPNTTSTITHTACNQYTWPLNGVTYTASGTYTYTSLNASGCLHTTTLLLTINYNTSSSAAVVACNSYFWPLTGLTYTQSGIYVHTNLNTQGCPNTDTLLLTINPSTSDTVYVFACDVYTWVVNGVTYSTSGTYTSTTTNTSGCPHIHVLVLNLGHTITTSHCDSACGSFTWPVNAITYTVSGTYTYVTYGPDGCPHIHILCLTILPNTASTVTMNVCESYTWPVNGVNYSLSGTYTHTALNAFGCVHTYTLILIVTPINVITTYDTVCGSYTWILNGVTYTTSGLYSYVITGTSGCPIIHTLCLTIKSPTFDTLNVIACDSYYWSQNGVTYTSSGTYTQTSINAAGCIHTSVLVLTIGTGSGSTHIFDTACISYYWPLNGVNYMMSGVYPYITVGPDGCPHVYILCITIKLPTTSDTMVTAVNAYFWNANNITYTSSGVYTATLTNNMGCDSLLTLHLDIVQVPSNSMAIAPKVLLNGPFNASTGLMEDYLRVLNLIPLNEPYSAAPMFKLQLLGGGGETTTNAVLSISGPNAIVDWVHLEIRSASNNSTILATKNALLQRDGDVVSSTDGISPLIFSGLAPGNYFVSIKHRNHLGVMTSSSIAINTSSITPINFTNLPLYVVPSITANTPAKQVGAINTLWSGDPNFNKHVKYNGSNNDKDPILISVGTGTPNNTVFGYRLEDLNMDGKVRYNNTDNDRAIIMTNIGVTTPNKILSQHTPN